MTAERDVFPVTPEEPVLKVTVYLKSGATVSFPGQYMVRGNQQGFAVVAPLEVPFVDFDAVALIVQEPWPEGQR